MVGESFRHAAGDGLTNGGCDLGAVQLDGAHHAEVIGGADGDLQEEPIVAEEFVLEQDLLDHLLRISDDQGAPRLDRAVEALPRRRRPAAFTTDPRHDLGVAGVDALTRWAEEWIVAGPQVTAQRGAARPVRMA